MKATVSSKVTFGFPLNYASALLAGLGIIFNVGLLYPYIDRIQVLHQVLDFYEWFPGLTAVLKEIFVLYIVVLTAHGIGILSRLGIIYASLQFRVIVLKVCYILITLELGLTLTCSSILIHRLTNDGPPIATLVGSILQIYCVAVFYMTDEAMRNEVKTGESGHSGARA